MYLRVTVTRNYKELFEYNFKPALDRAKLDLQRWCSLPISLAGRVNSVKTSIVPRLLFLFQKIPIFISKSFFKELDKNINTFLWNQTTPGVKRIFLLRHTEEGRFGLPNVIFYYWAANVHKIAYYYWISVLEDQSGLEWVNMERSLNGPTNLGSLACTPLPINLKYAGNPVIRGSLKIWVQCRTHFGLRQAFSCMPLTNNPLFPPSGVFCSKTTFLCLLLR